MESAQPKFSVFCPLIIFFSLQRSGNSWSLHLSNSSKRDAGLYECQVNTEPKIHLPFHLSVSGECLFSTCHNSYFLKEMIRNTFLSRYLTVMYILKLSDITLKALNLGTKGPIQPLCLLYPLKDLISEPFLYN